ncbi:MAG: hypothetical protein GY920_16805 [Aliivibrio sp.]|nr:hypothetical protein [Aliivibrio sp.]
MSNINHIVSDRNTRTFKIIDNNGDDILEVDSNNELKIGRGANKQTLVNSAGLPQVSNGGGGAVNELELGSGVQEAPIIVNLPCLYSEWPNPTVANLILTIDSTGRCRPIGDGGDGERTIVVGVSTEPITPNQTSIKVAIGGIVKMTVYNQCVAGDYLERNNQGQRLIKGAVQAQVRSGSNVFNPGYGVCAQALTSSPGSTDGSAKVLAILLQEQNTFVQDGNVN